MLMRPEQQMLPLAEALRLRTPAGTVRGGAGLLDVVGIPDPQLRVRGVEAGLLRGGPAAGPAGDPEGKVLYALYRADGRAVLSPWAEEPSLAPALRREGISRSRVLRTQGIQR